MDYQGCPGDWSNRWSREKARDDRKIQLADYNYNIKIQLSSMSPPLPGVPRGTGEEALKIIPYAIVLKPKKLRQPGRKLPRSGTIS